MREGTNERMYTATKHITTLLLRIRVKTSEPVNRLHSLIHQFIHYSDGKVSRYHVFNIFA